MAECQLHRVGTAGPRAPVHQLQFQWTPDLRQTFSFVQRFRPLTRQMGELNMRTTNIDESLGQHIVSTQNWQRYTGERIRNLEQQQQQSQEEWRAYYHWVGFNPNQQQ